MRGDEHREGGPEDGADPEPDGVGGEEGDPAAAFEALRARVEDLAGALGREMTTIRQGVELSLDRLEAQGTPADYSTDLGRLIQGLGTVSDRLRAVEQAPALRQGTDEIVRNFERQARVLELIDGQIAARFASARERRQQSLWLGGAGAAGTVVGLLLTLFLPRALPFSLAERMAATVMGQAPWAAGIGLLQFADPVSVERIAAADRLMKANAAAVAACRAATVQAGKEQSCTIIVPGSQP